MPAPEFTRVLVGWDGSAGASVGLELALHQTAAGGGEVTALAVVPGYTHVEDVDERKQAIEGARAPLQAAYDSVVDVTDLTPGQTVSLEFVEALDVAKALDRYSSTHPVGMVVVGLHGRGGLLHPKMGHIASHAVRTSRCPVLVVPDPGNPPPYPVEDEERSKLSGLFHPFRHHSDLAR